MEINLVVRLRCADSAQLRFMSRMLGDDLDRPLDEDDVNPNECAWFRALDTIDAPEEFRTAPPDLLYATWLGTDVDELLESVRRLAQLNPAELHAVVVGDEGWYRLWVRTDGVLKEYETWHGKDVIEIFEGSENVEHVLDQLAQQSSVR
jgi:hypothetical protein